MSLSFTRSSLTVSRESVAAPSADTTLPRATINNQRFPANQGVKKDGPHKTLIRKSYAFSNRPSRKFLGRSRLKGLPLPSKLRKKASSRKSTGRVGKRNVGHDIMEHISVLNRKRLAIQRDATDGGSLPQDSDLAPQVVPASPTLEADQTHLNASFSPCGTDRNTLPVLTGGSCNDKYFDEFMTSWRSCLQHKNNEKLEPSELVMNDDCATLMPARESFSGWENDVSATTLNFLSEHVKDFSGVPMKGADAELEKDFTRNDVEEFVPLAGELWPGTSSSHSMANEDRTLVAFPGDCQPEGAHMPGSAEEFQTYEDSSSIGPHPNLRPPITSPRRCTLQPHHLSSHKFFSREE